MKTWLLSSLLLIAKVGSYGASLDAFEQIEDQSGLEILSPSLKERQTAKIRLKNGLEAYIISDPGIEQSAAALAVGAGSWNDPIEYPGMAHFLEHMLFMGTKAYPKEFEYMQYINDQGGKVNAYTASDRTVYMFAINNAGFEGALDRFSHFFIDPLFLPTSIDRELLAVDQEHAKNLEHDGWRQYMIFKETGNPSHPNAKFSTGNADTLSGIPQTAMKKWYEENYNAKEMHLVILSALPIDQLIEMTLQDFSSITNNPNHTSKTISEKMTSTKQKGHCIYVRPIKDYKILSLSWEVEEEFAKDNEYQVGALISYILQSGSRNSLLALLKKEHLAENINVNEEKMGKGHKLFTIDLELTEKGLQNTDSVITYCFEAIARLKKTGIPRYIYDEVRQIAQLKYTYQSRQEAFEFVMAHAHTLVDEELSTYPKKSMLPTAYDPQVIRRYLDSLTAESCIYFVTAHPEKSGVTMTHRERWMNAEYAMKPIPQKELTTWAHASINPQIGLPPPNPYIPTNLTLAYKQQDRMPIPSLIQNDDKGKIFFASDERYQTPQVAFFYRIKSPTVNGSARSKALADLYLKAVLDELFSVTSAAEAAGAQIAINQANLALSVAINAYSDGSAKLTETIFQKMKKVRPSKKQFELYKASLSADYDNGEKELLFVQSVEILSNIIFNDAPTNREKLVALKDITYADFLEFNKSIFKQAYVEGLLYGNLTQTEAEKLWASISHKLSFSPYPVAEQHKRRILILPEGRGPYLVNHSTNMLGNATILMIDEGPYSFEKRGAQQVLGLVLKSDFFETLRTQQQTAYIAKAWDKEEERELVQFFAVQSSTHKPQELIARFELFLEDFVKQFGSKLPEERFQNIRRMAIQSLEMPPENLGLNGARLFLLGFDYDGDFNLVEKRVKALKELTYLDVKNAAIQFLSRSNSRRIAILIEGLTPKEKAFSYEEVSVQDLQNQGQFIAWK